jgi:alkaline phosphatase D
VDADPAAGGAHGEETRIYRRLRFGTLADLTMLDLRQYRDQQVSSTNGEAIDDPDRVMTGPEQQGFLEQGLPRPARRRGA